MNKQELASKIWESANRMRSKIEASEYKDFILGFIFYKFLSEQQLRFCLDNDFEQEDIEALSEDDPETVQYIQQNIGYFISYEHLYSTWIKKGIDFEISDVRDALSSFSRLVNKAHRRVFDGIFETLQTGLSKLGTSTGEQTKAASSLIHLIQTIPMDGKQDYDILGFIYEYLISNFAANAGKKAGEFYTPHEVSLLMAQIVAHHLRDKDHIRIYDPTSGSGSLLINIGKAVAAHGVDPDAIKYYAQELKQNTFNLTRMNLVMRGIKPDNIVTRNGDTLEDDWPLFQDEDPSATYEFVPVDAVVSNPPYSQAWDPSDKDTDPRYSYGLAPKSKADYAFLLHDLFHLRPEGIMTIVLPHGVLFRGGEEGQIRRNLIENRHIAAIIGLPANIFFGTGIPTIVMVLQQKRADSSILFVDASKGFEKVGKNNRLRACDIKKITDVVTGRVEIEKFSRVVSIEEIRANDYNLNIPRYVDSSEETESYDIYASMFGGVPAAEAEKLAEYWQAWPSLKQALFADVSAPYLQLQVEDIAAAVAANQDVAAYKQAFRTVFGDWDGDLHHQLINNATTLDLGTVHNDVVQQLFSRLQKLPLVDRYAAYQVLDDQWQTVAGDLEIIQTEGLRAANVVDPNMVYKKQGNKEQEVQDGWVGRLIPLELVKEIHLQDQLKQLTGIDNRLAEITSEYSQLLEELPEEDKGNPTINETQDDWVAKEVTKEAKVLAKDQAKGASYDEGSYEATILQVAALINEEKQLKKDSKTLKIELDEKAKATIEQLTEEQVKDLLHRKWIEPMIAAIVAMSDDVVNDFVGEVKKLGEKYSETLTSIDAQIKEAEASLLSMLDDLTGNEYDMAGIQEFKRLLGGI